MVSVVAWRAGALYSFIICETWFSGSFCRPFRGPVNVFIVGARAKSWLRFCRQQRMLFLSTMYSLSACRFEDRSAARITFFFNAAVLWYHIGSIFKAEACEIAPTDATKQLVLLLRYTQQASAKFRNVTTHRNLRRSSYSFSWNVRT